MDQAIRNQLQRATQAARTLLEQEFAAQLEGTYDILPDGTIAKKVGRTLMGPVVWSVGNWSKPFSTGWRVGRRRPTPWATIAARRPSPV